MIDTSSAALFAGDVMLEEVTPLPDGAPLFPAEEALVATAGLKRRREFAAGRLCAQRALARFGIHGVAIGAGPDRAPRWPAGVVGSITHSDRYCAAAVAWRSAYAALGIDAEPDEPLEQNLWEIVCTAAELRWLTEQPAQTRGRLARLIFSAKESAYKCQYPLTGAVLDFHDARIELEPAQGRFTATFMHAAGATLPGGGTIAGKFRIDGGMIRTGIALPAARPTLEQPVPMAFAPQLAVRQHRSPAGRIRR